MLALMLLPFRILIAVFIWCGTARSSFDCIQTAFQLHTATFIAVRRVFVRSKHVTLTTVCKVA